MSIRHRSNVTKPQISQISDNDFHDDIVKASVAENVVGQNLIEDEKMEIGGVKWEVYYHYARSIGWFFSIGTFALYLVYQGFSIGNMY